MFVKVKQMDCGHSVKEREFHKFTTIEAEETKNEFPKSDVTKILKTNEHPLAIDDLGLK